MTEFEKLLHVLMQDANNEEETEKKSNEKELAEKTYELYKEFIEAGFNEEQAFELLTIILRREH